MEDTLFLLIPVLILGLNFALWRWTRGYTRFAGAALFVLLSGLIGTPLVGALCWQVAHIQPSYGYSQGDALVSIGMALFNALVALIGAIAAALRKPVGASGKEGGSDRVRLRSDWDR